MRTRLSIRPIQAIACLTLLSAALDAQAISQNGTAKRPMTFMDMQSMRTAASPAVSPDGRWMLYSLSTPDWKINRRQSDLYVVSTSGGLPTTRQLTFTKDKNEGPARWAPDGGFVFASDRESISSMTPAAPAAGRGGGRGGPASAGGSQLFYMRTDGGEA